MTPDDAEDDRTLRLQPGSAWGLPQPPVRHAYPLLARDALLGAAAGLLMRSLPYAVARFVLLLVASVVVIVWLTMAIGGGAFLGSQTASIFGLIWMVGCLVVFVLRGRRAIRTSSSSPTPSRVVARSGGVAAALQPDCPAMWRVLLCLMLCSCAGGETVRTAIDAYARSRMAADPAAYSNGDSRSWLVRRDGADHGLLWGTYHRGYDEATIPPSTIRDRVESAADLTVEVNLTDANPTAIAALMAPCGRASLARDEGAIASLDPATKAALNDTWLPGEIKTKGSLLGLSWAVNGRNNGNAPTGNADTVLIQLAKAHGVRIFTLERPQAQIAMLCRDPNGPLAALYLKEALLRGSDAAILADYARAEYQQGHVALVIAASHWPPGPDTATGEALERQSLFTSRNPAMLRRIERRLDTPGFHVVAIGAGHLVGHDGIVAGLQAAGWEVVPCPADRC